MNGKTQHISKVSPNKKKKEKLGDVQRSNGWEFFNNKVRYEPTVKEVYPNLKRIIKMDAYPDTS